MLLHNFFIQSRTSVSHAARLELVNYKKYKEYKMNFVKRCHGTVAADC